MKNILPIFLILTLLSCNKNDNESDDTIGQITSILVAPIQTDANYLSNDKEHYIVRNNISHQNILVLFIGGSFSTPENYNVICNHSASIGFDVISLSYPNNVPAAPLGTSDDPFIFDNYRDEICFGNSVSDEVSVNVLNSINTRTIKLLEYLSNNYPEQNWAQYLTASNTLNWNKIIVAGHSQGSGHACYFGKQNAVNKVLMFSGPNDYSSFFNEPANWLIESGETSLDNYYSLLHIQDQIVSFDNQVDNLRGLGLLNTNENPTLADNLTTPFANANALSLNINALSNHNSTIGNNSKLPAIWTYMLSN